VLEATPHGLRLDVGGLGEVAAPPAEAVRAGIEGVLAIRPEQVRIIAANAVQELKNHFVGTVHDLLYIGDVTTYVVNCPTVHGSRRCCPTRHRAGRRFSRSATR